MLCRAVCQVLICPPPRSSKVGLWLFHEVGPQTIYLSRYSSLCTPPASFHATLCPVLCTDSIFCWLSPALRGYSREEPGGLTVVGRVGTREMLEWHKARVSGVTGVYTLLLRRLRHTHKKRGLVAYTVRSKVAMLKYSATCQRALEEGLMEREGGALRTTWCCGAALLYIARTCPSLKSLSHTDS
jgi:hypothetical protein